MFGNVTALEGLHVTGKYRNESMLHTCDRHAAWVLDTNATGQIPVPALLRLSCPRF